ncbi:DUF58 domain-containing protein [Plantactinospora sp. CA-290183]|uniref:DUF58 domain-containing protein n=1 Tax=Plantactinospora sp. CA-290183 TaxID=3240006 RepID=UPI003D8B1A09
MRLTRRGLAVLVSGALSLLFGLWAGYPFLAALGAVGLAAVLAALLLTARRLAVTVRRSVYPDRVERGRPALASLRVGNPGERRAAGFLATDPAGGVTRTVRVRTLPPGAETVHHYELPTGTRGRLTVGPLTLHRVDPFGLARNRLAIGASATLWVHPRQLPARPPAGAHPRHHHEGVSTDDALRGSIDLQDVREYVPGDEVRHLHWKATARTGRLMVRDLTDPAQPRFTLLLDTRTDALTGEDFEESVDLAASLLCAAARAGQHTRLVTSAGLDLGVPGGVRSARRVLDELCELRQEGARDAAVVPPALSPVRAGGGALMVVAAGTAGLAPLAGLRHRYSMILVVTLGDVPAESPPVAGVRVLHASDAAEAVRRWNEAGR